MPKNIIMLRNSINRNEHIKRLSRAHHSRLLFCWKIRQGLKKNVSMERICKYVRYFWQQHLQPHFLEEEIIFAVIKDRQVQRAMNEHQQIRKEIENLAYYSQKGVRKALENIADMVDEHVRYAKRELFPHLERKFSKEQSENIEKQIERHRPLSLQDLYEDQFWNI